MNQKLATVAAAILASALASPAMADTPPPVVRHSGMCDASAAVPVGSNLFAVANDEDNTLRIYKRDESGEPVNPPQDDLSGFLKIDNKTDPNPEADIEGATLIGNRIYWISSHGENEDGDPRPNRHRFFATDIETDGDKITLKPVGIPFLGLVQALADSAGLKAYNLGNAAEQATKSRDGLNIEGLTSTPEGNLLIGFRSPIPDGKALLVPLENPQAVIDGKEQPKLGKPIPLYLGGLGIRSIEYSDASKAYFIIAGSYDKAGDFRLYQWPVNASEAEQIKGVDFQGLNPEALIVYPEEKARIQILSDDGAEKPTGGKKCKKLPPQDQGFRSIWVSLKP